MYSTYCTLVSLVPWHWSRGVWQLGRAWQGDRSGAETNSQEAGSQPAPHTVTISERENLTSMTITMDYYVTIVRTLLG